MHLPKIFPLFLLVLLAAKSFAQAPDVSGRYEGTADIQTFGKLKISAEIRQSNGKISGTFNTPLGEATIVAGNIKEQNLYLTVDAGGDDLVLKGKLSAGGRISGVISGALANGKFELARIGNATPIVDTTVNLNLTKEQWREDLHFLAAELPKRHKNAFNLISRERFENLIGELNAKITSLTNEEIVLEMSKIVSRIGDGHTGLSWNWQFPRMPMRLFWFDRELRVTEIAKEFSRVNGARIIKIGGVPIEKIYEQSREYIAPNESEQFVLNASQNLFTYPVFLKSIGAAKFKERAIFEFVDSNGKRFLQEIRASMNGEQREFIKPYKTAPLAAQNPDAPFHFEYLKDAKTVYVNFRWYPRRNEFRKFSAELFDFIDKHAVEKLVFDMRENGGGDFTRGRDFFVKPLKERKKFLEKGNLFVIAGRVTYSAGMTNTADFRNDLNAIIVGEPTGARPIGYMENRGFYLPNSHLPISFSIQFYKFSETDTPGIIPDKLIAPDWKSYQSGRDAALEWILAYPNPKNKL